MAAAAAQSPAHSSLDVVRIHVGADSREPSKSQSQSEIYTPRFHEPGATLNAYGNTARALIDLIQQGNDESGLPLRKQLTQGERQQLFVQLARYPPVQRTKDIPHGGLLRQRSFGHDTASAHSSRSNSLTPWDLDLSEEALRSLRVTKQHLLRYLESECAALDLPPEVAASVAKHAWREAPVPAGDVLDWDQFDQLASNWHLPSRKTVSQSVDGAAVRYDRKLPWRRRFLAHCSVDGPVIVFYLLLTALQVALALYYALYTYNSNIYDVVGNSTVVAKCGAGIVYPSMALALLSSSRRLLQGVRSMTRGWATHLINFDVAQAVHIWAGWCMLIGGVLHSVSHLAGTFVACNKDPLNPILADRGFPQPATYSNLLLTKAGIGGLISLFLMLLIVFFAHTTIRQRLFDVFQLTHLLIFLAIASLLVHGSDGLLQPPVLGWWLIVPVLAVLWDRVSRLLISLRSPVKGASAHVLSDKMVVVSFPISSISLQSFEPGQYVLVQCPQLSRWQWHPFSLVPLYDDEEDPLWDDLEEHLVPQHTKGRAAAVARAVANIPGHSSLQAVEPVPVSPANVLHGTRASPSPSSCSNRPEQSVSCKSPRGSPRQLRAVQVFINVAGDWTRNLHRRAKAQEPLEFRIDGPFGSPATSLDEYKHVLVLGANVGITPYAGWMAAVSPGQVADLHWIVREHETFGWFSALLNTTARVNEGVRLHTYLTAQAPRQISAHVCRCLIEQHRTLSFPRSALTGLACRTHFGRPDLERVFASAQARLPRDYKGRIGVFFCGPHLLGIEISDRCRELRSQTGAKWEYKGEIF